MNRNSVLKLAFPHMCSTHVRYEYKKETIFKQLPCCQEDKLTLKKREDVDILLLIVYL